MSLSSSLFTGTSGLKNMGNALQVTGNNISNLNTIGFKKGRATFADTLYESVATGGGTDQMGRGMAVGDVAQNFSQGSFESTGNTTDLSIGGDGFFVMRQSNTENTFYTRAGNFFFNKEGELVNPEGYIVQGWELDEETADDVGSIDDVILKAFTNPPKKSTQVTAITNLDADALSNSVVLSNNWDSGEDTYMAANNYEYQTVVKVYDALGSTHDASIYYDKKSGTEWEYIISCNPEEDQRNLVQGTDSKGLLARGTILFSQSSGDITDLTMSKFTGRLGNFQANGVNTTDSINYEILNSDQLASDGYGFEFNFDGSSWDFVGGVRPTNYLSAEIVYSDDQEIRLVLDSATGTDPDLIIKLDQPAVATDSFGFDINDPNGLHIQNIEGTRYLNETANDNTTLEINDSSVMTHDSTGLGIVWNPVGGPDDNGEWTWSNPIIANTATVDNPSGTLVSGPEMNGAAWPDLVAGTPVLDVTNAEDLSMVSTDVTLRYDGADWQWNDLIKEEDFTNTYTLSPSPSSMSITAGSERSRATTAPVEVFWDDINSGWSLTAAGITTTSTVGTGIGGKMVEILPSSSSTQLTFDIWDGTAAKDVVTTPPVYTTVTYNFGSAVQDDPSQSIQFEMLPTPPREYPDAEITNSVADASFTINFDTDSIQDLAVDPAAGGAVIGGDVFSFDIDPNVPPAEYLNATLKGDHEAVVIDLDGSGNESDNDDIRFVFDDSLSFGSSTHPYDDRSEIDFDILGSTAWTQTDKNDIEQTGYYSFVADFLGGEYGTTETDIQLDLGTMYNGINFENDSLSTTQYAKSSSTVFQDANGYSAGDLQGVDVASDGVITGIYSNGQLIPLFRVGLAKFLNNHGLNLEGGNLYSETRDSGSAITNKPGENGLGTISPNSLEMSNVDISEEFVALITNQRGFQANSKTITTVDDMMSTVIQMKR
jgi:flagellar hook-basal body protein